jgi:hypothetical protein
MSPILPTVEPGNGDTDIGTLQVQRVGEPICSVVWQLASSRRGLATRVKSQDVV